jgi:hypothetical protein
MTDLAIKQVKAPRERGRGGRGSGSSEDASGTGRRKIILLTIFMRLVLSINNADKGKMVRCQWFRIIALLNKNVTCEKP